MRDGIHAARHRRIAAAALALACLAAPGFAGPSPAPAQELGGVVWPILPDPLLTPGAVTHPPTPLSELCRPGETDEARHVTAATKRAVYARYGLPDVGGAAEVDHRVPLAVDGDNVVANLWPEHYATTPANARRKDTLEGNIRRRLCVRHTMTLMQAQAVFLAADWRVEYRRWVGPLPGTDRAVSRRK